jgi:hypothetical protein
VISKVKKEENGGIKNEKEEMGSEGVEIDDFAAEQVPATIVEKICDLIIGRATQLDLVLSITSVLCKYGTFLSPPFLFIFFFLFFLPFSLPFRAAFFC